MHHQFGEDVVGVDNGDGMDGGGLHDLVVIEIEELGYDVEFVFVGTGGGERENGFDGLGIGARLLLVLIVLGCGGEHDGGAAELGAYHAEVGEIGGGAGAGDDAGVLSVG